MKKGSSHHAAARARAKIDENAAAGQPGLLWGERRAEHGGSESGQSERVRFTHSNEQKRTNLACPEDGGKRRQGHLAVNKPSSACSRCSGACGSVKACQGRCRRAAAGAGPGCSRCCVALGYRKVPRVLGGAGGKNDLWGRVK